MPSVLHPDPGHFSPDTCITQSLHNELSCKSPSVKSRGTSNARFHASNNEGVFPNCTRSWVTVQRENPTAQSCCCCSFFATTPLSRVRFRARVILELVKQFPAVYGTEAFINIFKKIPSRDPVFFVIRIIILTLTQQPHGEIKCSALVNFRVPQKRRIC